MSQSPRAIDHPWEQIYRERGRFENKPFLEFDRIVRAFEERGCDRILDLGCGTGRHVIALARRGFVVVGADISPTALRLTRDWLHQEQLAAGLAQLDWRSPLPFRSASFAGIFSTQVIHHARISEIRLAIAEMFRLLTPNGLAFVTVSGLKGEGEAFEQIEPGTFVPQAGPEEGLPHHIFGADELAHEFRRFKLQAQFEWAEGKVLAILATKPRSSH